MLKTPYILVASPDLKDPNFFATVLLVAEHTNGGALGFVLNRPSRRQVGDLFTGEVTGVAREAISWQGGPVSPGLGVAIHSMKAATGETMLNSQVSVSSWENLIARLTVDTLPSKESLFLYPYRFVAGYAGWGSGQLEDEMARGSWFAIEFDSHLAFNTAPQEMWNLAIRTWVRRSGKTHPENPLVAKQEVRRDDLHVFVTAPTSRTLH